MLGHTTMLGMTTMATILTVANCGFCNVVSVGSTDGEETMRTAVIPAGINKYDIKVQPLCREDDIVGLKASGCNEYNWSLTIADKFTVHIDRDESPDEIFVKLSVYCNFSNTAEETNGEEYNPKEEDELNKKVVKRYNDTSAENIITGNVLVALENNVEQNVFFVRKQSTNMEKDTANIDLENKTSEDTFSDNFDMTAAPKQKPEKVKPEKVKPVKVKPEKVKSKEKKVEKKNKKDAEKTMKKWMKKMKI